ncbi:Swi5-dependent recombination DNA repair protein [Actinidia chinensis var. chinensis]|uniref:Swi5-dependent recombination DNA repair protein n=1 Tax=Actinidia chinensis var. chinensis TaxID=1590841 RepID=A0A2R6RC50_ACTCC|nr:Swi5-dependent recombination DNA repair protein [Actinidia chinensis var. chinensis]
MAVSGSRSPSPISSRPNPNSRTPESNSTARSFSGNPFPRPLIFTNPRSFNPVTPANSPADLGRKHSIGKETGGLSRGYEEKENEKDQNLKSEKVRSPAITKGSKNFMTPTISAASKINSSPRKKVLVERNEPVRTSISFSDGKSRVGSVNLSDVTEIKDSNTEMGLNLNTVEDSNESTISNSDHKESVLEIPLSLSSQVPLNSHFFSGSLSDAKPVESNCMNKPFGSPISPIIAPLDADPSLPPYDPKTNYLSPRPQFLHYKPNPRIELFLQKEKGIGTEQGKSLEESFLSESFSDSEVTAEFESESSHKESEDDSSVDVTNEELETHVVEPPIKTPTSTHVVEPPIKTPISSHLSEDFVEEKIIHKPLFLTRSNSIAFLLVLLIACLSVPVTDTPVFDLLVYKDLGISKFPDPSEITEFAKASLDGFARKFKEWSAKSVDYLSKAIHISNEVDKLGPLQFSNLTFSLEDPFVDGYLQFDHSEERSEEIDEQDESELVTEGEVETEQVEENLEKGDGDNSQESLEASHDSSEVIEHDSSVVVLNQEQNSIAFENQLGLDPKVPELEVVVLEVNPEFVETGEVQADNENFGAKFESNVQDASFGAVPRSESVDYSRNWPEDKFSVAISLLALALMAPILFVYLKHRRITTAPNTAALLEPLMTKKPMISSHTSPAEVDLVGESCPSEMSSVQKSSSYSKQGVRGADDETQSQLRKERRVSKRESLASSSEYSMDTTPSYGSFTTYEKIPNKHGCGDEEIATPVRRSSRIKNQVTSP